MGDYYKIKKILLICMIVLTVLRIFKGSSVFASEAVEVTPTWNDGDYTYQSDNQILTLRQNQIDIQDSLINFFYNFYASGSETQKNNAKNTLSNIKQNMITSVPGGTNWGGIYTRMVWFSRVTTSVNGTNNYGYCYQITSMSFLNNIVYADATLNTGYKLLGVPFYSFSRSSARPFRFVNVSDGTFYSVETGDALIPVAEVGVYSTRWVDLFEYYGLITSTEEYQNILDNIEGTQSLIYQQELTQSYYATENNEILSNTYNYLESTQHTDETSMPFQTITANDPYDFTDFLDNLEDILTNENYVSKQFTLTLPNNRSFNFSINPNMTEQLLTRIGGENVFGIITVMWYMGIYGIIIFDFKRMLNQILSGDWMNITTDSSPIDNVVSASFNATGATSTSSSHSGGDR